MTDLSGIFRFRFSLRGLLAFVTLFVVACAALKYAGDTWWIVLSSVSLLLFMAMAVLAFVGRGERRAFAIGFVICVAIYGLLLFLGGDTAEPSVDRLPTTKLLLPVHYAMKDVIWIVDGQEMPKGYTPTQAQLTAGGGGYFGGGTMPPRRQERPELLEFLPIGHLLWAVLMGWVGGLFARFVYIQNERHAE